MADNDDNGQYASPDEPDTAPDAPILNDRVERRGGSGRSIPISQPPMQTLLSRFCDDLESTIRPLLDPITRTADGLGTTNEMPVQVLLPRLNDLHRDLQQLVEKMAEQQAYVLIFGPLKSGKSTFMNAVAAKYVSEVTCLPAYPCLVQVSHAEETNFCVVHYDGETEMHDDQERLHQAVEANHRTLVETIRRCELDGIGFEPAQHAPHAIRSIQVKVPAGDLAQSGAVLVDTPGLYSRMKFGYDRMTKDFRNAAACAIFVVKTDNLFLDQVFNEFQELLELFSRIFLIVNLDATKQDLQPDGSLQPALEHADPEAVVRAFENLSMSASVKAARDDGRLRIYPVDLLGAASRRIRASEAGGVSGTHHGAPAGQADFDALLGDLTDYLNSSDYLRAFVGDSLNRAGALLTDLNRLLTDESISHLEVRVQRLTEEEDAMTRRRAALDRLVSTDWQTYLERYRQPLQDAVREQIEAVRRSVANTVHGAIDSWFDTDASLDALLRHDLEPTLARCRTECLELVRSELHTRLVKSAASNDLTSEQCGDFETALVDPCQAAQDALQSVALEKHLSAPIPTLGSNLIPVRRGIIDWLLLRSTATVRRRLFGPPAATDQPIAPALKADRLGDRARDAMRAQLDNTLNPFIERAARQLPKDAFDAYVAAFTKRLADALAGAGSETRTRLELVSARREDAAGVFGRLQGLRTLASPAEADVSALRRKFHQIESDARQEETIRRDGTVTSA